MDYIVECMNDYERIFENTGHGYHLRTKIKKARYGYYVYFNFEDIARELKVDKEDIERIILDSEEANERRVRDGYIYSALLYELEEYKENTDFSDWITHVIKTVEFGTEDYREIEESMMR